MGAFRTGQVTIAGTEHQPPAHAKLEVIFAEGLKRLMLIDSVHERAFATFLFGAPSTSFSMTATSASFAC